MKTTLLIMAAGIGSRFGTGIKQLEPVDDAGHIIMDYSIHDAIEAGFNHVVFIIRKDIEKEFKEVIGGRIASICASHDVTVDYAFQDINDIPGELPEGRTKPWGTGQAVLAAKKVLDTPFIVINADDYYGKEVPNKTISDKLVLLTSQPIQDRCLLLTTERCVIIRAAQGATAPSISQFHPVLQTFSCLHRYIVQ